MCGRNGHPDPICLALRTKGKTGKEVPVAVIKTKVLSNLLVKESLH